MDFMIIAFRSRFETVKFSEFLTKNGIKNRIINTPKEAGVGCGLSVAIDSAFFNVVKKAVHNFSAKSFAGFFTVKTVNGKRTVRSI